MRLCIRYIKAIQVSTVQLRAQKEKGIAGTTMSWTQNTAALKLFYKERYTRSKIQLF